ncbi:uridylate kinase [Lichtheimia corymbifera JMRC:FSU:9682]|uniref:Uridylate kinase n=1 Tax=Lichtheimia corymbifera JMRC:FSU:9682 TaxID=1263082 RepID=A0A068S8N1_9FUNG|nr:uridylate kinase [Lichtheimia corymbifera JMRC:FSU:9682]
MTDEKDKAQHAHQSIIDLFPILFNWMISLQQQSIFKPIYYLWGVKEALLLSLSSVALVVVKELNANSSSKITALSICQPVTYCVQSRVVKVRNTAIKEARDNDGKTRFLVDGFPRKMDQAIKFEEVVVESKFTLYFECSEETLLNRLLKRGESSGRVDDNIESIKKRFQTFKETSYPVIEYYEQKGKAFKVNAEQSKEEVYNDIKKILDGALN